MSFCVYVRFLLFFFSIFSSSLFVLSACGAACNVLQCTRATVCPAAIMSSANGFATALRVCPPLPFHFFKQWRMHDFHTSKWTRVNPSAQIKRTRLGRSCVDQPTMDMVSVSRYGGHTQRETLAKAFRVYRSVDSSEEARRTGQEVLQAIKFADFALGTEEEEDLAVDFACLYLNACVLFGFVPTQEIMSQLLTWLATSLHSSFHWECVFCALIVFLQPSRGIVATTTTEATAAMFVSMLRGAHAGTIPGSLSRQGGILLLLVISRALDVLLRVSERAEDCQYILDVQLQTIEIICSSAATTPSPSHSPCLSSREEMLTVVDAICWRYAAGGSLCKAVVKLIPLLQVKTHAGLEELSVSQCARLFCTLCILLAAQCSTGKEWSAEWQSNVLDPIVRYLDERVRVHTVNDVVFILMGLQANNTARLRYKKFPSALLDYIRDQHQQCQSQESQEEEECKSLTNWGTESSQQALTHVLSQLVNGVEDELGDAAETLLKDLTSSEQLS